LLLRALLPSYYAIGRITSVTGPRDIWRFKVLKVWNCWNDWNYWNGTSHVEL